jgi:hypothetical protein
MDKWEGWQIWVTKVLLLMTSRSGLWRCPLTTALRHWSRYSTNHGWEVYWADSVTDRVTYDWFRCTYDIKIMSDNLNTLHHTHENGCIYRVGHTTQGRHAGGEAKLACSTSIYYVHILSRASYELGHSLEQTFCLAKVSCCMLDRKFSFVHPSPLNLIEWECIMIYFFPL